MQQIYVQVCDAQKYGKVENETKQNRSLNLFLVDIRSLY